MNRWQRQRRLDDCQATLERLMTEIPRLVGTLEAMTAGYAKAKRFDRDVVSGEDVGDPTGDSAVVSDPQGARTDLELLDDLITETHGKLIEIDLMRHRWLVRPKGGPLDDPGCEIVARVRNEETGQPFWEPVHVFSDAKGNLDRPHRLGSWAYRFVLDTGRKPSLKETKAHIEGRKIRHQAS